MNAKVLVIDRNHQDQENITQALKETGFDFQITTEDSGENAILQLDRIAPDIVIVDTCLTGIDGFETTRQIKTKNRQIKVILLTGEIDKIDDMKAKMSGADEYTVKGRRYSALVERINKIMSGHAPQERVVH